MRSPGNLPGRMASRLSPPRLRIVVPLLWTYLGLARRLAVLVIHWVRVGCMWLCSPSALGQASGASVAAFSKWLRSSVRRICRPGDISLYVPEGPALLRR